MAAKFAEFGVGAPNRDELLSRPDVPMRECKAEAPTLFAEAINNVSFLDRWAVK